MLKGENYNDNHLKMTDTADQYDNSGHNYANKVCLRNYTILPDNDSICDIYEPIKWQHLVLPIVHNPTIMPTP